MPKLRFIGGVLHGENRDVSAELVPYVALAAEIPPATYAETDRAPDSYDVHRYARRTVALPHPEGAYFPRRFEDLMVLTTLSDDEALALWKKL